MEPRENQEFEFNNAYEEINFYQCSEKSHQNKPIISCVKGPKQFNGLFSKVQDNRIIEKQHKMKNCQHLQSQNNGLFFNSQPLFLEEVDHHIQQIGLMAVKQVRYVTEQQWQQMMKEQQKYMREMKKIDNEFKYESRQKQANKRKRNKKGQFVPKEQKQQMNQKIQDQKEKKININNKRKKIQRKKQCSEYKKLIKKGKIKQSIFQSDDN